MSYVISLFVSKIKSINRTIVVNEDIPINLFIKSLIVSMNGSPKELYILENSEEILLFDDNDTLDKLKLNVGDEYEINYRYDSKTWIFNFKVLEKNKGTNLKNIEVIDGHGYGIYENDDMFFIRELINTPNKKWRDNLLSYYKKLNTYFNLKFSLEDCNRLVDEYGQLYKKTHSPSSMIMSVSLEGFNKEIKRKIIVNNNIGIDKFCRAIIASMRGDMGHLYSIKVKRKMYGDDILEYNLSYLDIEAKDKFTVVYDFGDNWEFNVRVSKIVSGYHDKDFEILDGTGYGIVEDCCGAYGLWNIFNGKDKSWGKHNINEFNLEKLQKSVEHQLKIENLHSERIEYY